MGVACSGRRSGCLSCVFTPQVLFRSSSRLVSSHLGPAPRSRGRAAHSLGDRLVWDSRTSCLVTTHLRDMVRQRPPSLGGRNNLHVRDIKQKRHQGGPGNKDASVSGLRACVRAAGAPAGDLPVPKPMSLSLLCFLAWSGICSGSQLENCAMLPCRVTALRSYQPGCVMNEANIASSHAVGRVRGDR
jgi:hypothetical protein